MKYAFEMATTVLWGLALLVLTAAVANAQTATSETYSQANNTANQISASGAASFGNSINIEAPQPTVGPDGMATSRVITSQAGTATTEVRNVPALGGLALGGGHPCAYSPVTAQFTIVGGGAGAGGMKMDSACMLLIAAAQAGDERAYMSALYMIAKRDPEACDAMEIMYNIVCDGRDNIYTAPERVEPVVSTSNVAQPVKVAYAKCEIDGAKVVFRRKPGQDSAVAKAQCLKALGY